MPNRELAVIGTFDLPKTKQTGAFKVDVFVYLDRKNKPSDKTGLIANGDINIEKNSGSVNGEVKFIYPSQPKVRIAGIFIERFLNLYVEITLNDVRDF